MYEYILLLPLYSLGRSYRGLYYPAQPPLFLGIYILLPAQILFLKYELFPRLVELWRGVAVQFLYLCRPLNQLSEPEVLTKDSIK